MHFLKSIGAKLNIARQCRELNVGLWSCPQFLFVIMGLMIIGAIFVTYVIAQRYAEVEIVALIVMILTAFLFSVSYVIVGAFETVVEARRLEAKHSKALLELKDQFVFVAAHELRTPANAIQESMRRLESKHDEFFEKEKEIVENIKDSNNRLLALVEDLLEVARIEGKTIHIALEDISVPKVYDEAKDELEEMARSRGVVITEDISHDVPLVHADDMRLKEVLVNFLSNAIKYSDPEDGKVLVKVADRDEEIVISVSNNGPQIKPEEQEHVFQKFWRSKNAQKSKVEGTGLGLFIVKQLAELMEGRTWFTSRPDKTTFFIALKKASPANTTN